MTALLIAVALACLALGLACWWADNQPPLEPDPFDQPRHVRVLDDQEQNRT